MNRPEHPREATKEAQEKDKPLDSVNVAELTGKLGAGFLGLSFVSGYLIVNTYLSSFGIREDAGDLFKAKYIYVGFLYLLFMSVIVLPFAAVKQAMDIWSPASGGNGEGKDSSAEQDKQVIITRESFLVWILVVMAFEIPISLQITLLQPKNVKDFLLIQLALLCAVFLYQLTYYRSYNDDEWDRLSRVVYHRRWCCFGIEALIGVVIIASLFARQMLPNLAAAYRGHTAWQLATPFLVTFFLTWMLKPLFLTVAETAAMDAREKSSWKWLKRKWTVIFISSAFAVCLLAAPALVHYWIRWFLIQTGTLVAAITVLCGVVVLSIMANQRRERDAARRKKPDPEEQKAVAHEQTGRWIRWILRVSSVVTLYVISTLGYAYVVYSHIPVQKEGGDYTTSPVVRVTLKPPEDLPKKQSGGASNVGQKDGTTRQTSAAESARPQDVAFEKSICPPNGFCDEVVILEQTSSFLYVARLSDWTGNIRKDHCGPKHWRDGILEEGGPYRPHVISIPLVDIKGIEQTGFFDTKGCL
jgi:hypothetical protein